MKRNRGTIFCSLVAVLLCGVGGVSSLTGAGLQPKKTDGQYAITVGGYFQGSGTATVSSTRVRFRARVRNEAGRSSNFATFLRLDGDHFEGTANVAGTTFTFRGRLDGYAAERNFRGARILCNYTDGNGNVGKVAGVLQ